jgi:phosphatidylserine/phosphatidylglycerophosphate/cardiolipin synthase-like enzyme
MQRVLSSDLWKTVTAQARKAKQRQAAIAYVTNDHLNLKSGDVLIVDASEATIRSGGTDAKLLDDLQQRGVILYDCHDLHAKVMLLGDMAVVGSANMSQSSGSLVEAAIITDQSSIVSGVASFIEQLKKKTNRISTAKIAELCKIEVIRRGGGAPQGKRKNPVKRLGNQTWLVGVKDLVREPPADEQRKIAIAAEKLELKKDELHWLRWRSDSKFAKKCCAGDQLIQIWKRAGAKRLIVCSAVPVLLKQKSAKWTRFYLGERSTRHPDLTWGRFKQLVKDLGYPSKVGPGIVQLVEPYMAEAFDNAWNSAAKS